ncbi:sigma-70 family RNA polymerase sigma factor [Mycobacterium sp.]|uniref:sigma-70 family RNA polymerase sigma factor n=1 Tax=Mycobacterium sp. TaxID=1785 RepID=UPI00333FBFB2
MHDSLFGIARQLTSTVVDAEDLLQQTMVKAYSRFSSYRSDTHLKAWLVRIMRNTWIDDHRRNKARPLEHLTADVGDWEERAYERHAGSGRDTVEDRVIESSVELEVRRAVRQLPLDLRTVIYYAYVEGLPHKQIAEIEAIPVGTVMSRLYRARKQLHGLLVETLPVSVERSDLAEAVLPAFAPTTTPAAVSPYPPPAA